MNRLRKFIAKPSAGLRIRIHPTLQSEQIGVVPVEGTISIDDEYHTEHLGEWVELLARHVAQLEPNRRVSNHKGEGE